MSKRKIITLYWDGDDGDTTIEIHKTLFGVDHLDFYNDAIALLNNTLNSKDAVMELIQK